MSSTDRSTGWFPIASSSDLAYRTTHHAQILGREFVAWRADDDYVNVWENRCLHRGLRLTRGINDGAELACQYHGWRYSSVSAGCTYIPAHPADAPARTISNRTYPSAEKYGLVWSGEAVTGEPPVIDHLETAATPLRPIPVNAPSEMVLDALAGYEFLPTHTIGAAPNASADWRTYQSALEADVSALERSEHAVILRSANAAGSTTAVLLVQPVDAARVVIRGVLDADLASLPLETQLAVLRHHNERLSRLRDAMHEQAAHLPMPDPLEVSIGEVAVELSALPETTGTQAPLRVQVARKWETAIDTVGVELTSIDGSLITFQPGAHIDVHLPNGLVRQYSLTNRPGELDRYRIGVKREPKSTGGSSAIHDTVRQGDVLAISAPRNNFSLRRDSLRTVLIAGGIGLTPLLAMAQSLHHSALPYELHVFARERRFVPFRELLEPLADHTTEHLGLDPAATGARIREVVGARSEAAHLYICGPGPMIAATRQIAGALGWPDESVHFEYFANPTDIDDSGGFDIALARSAVTLRVEPGNSILEALRSHGIEMPSSCEQGACGTCVVPLISGEPLHQDVYLNATEHAAGERIATCVSRALSDRLVLDL